MTSPRDSILRAAVASKRLLARTPLRPLTTSRTAEAVRGWLVRRHLEGTEEITVRGITVEVPATFAAHSAGGFEPLSIGWLCDVSRPGHLVFDVGAHVGVVACVAATAVGGTGAVVTVEPDARAHGLLRKNLSRNGLAATVTVVEAAAGATSGTATMVPHRNMDASHLTVRRQRRGTTVPVVTIDQLAQRFGFPDVVKIDVEGWELEVLAGMERVLERRPRLLIEINPARLQAAGHRPEDLIDRLRGHGYSPAVIDDLRGRRLSVEEVLAELPTLPSNWYANLACDG